MNHPTGQPDEMAEFREFAAEFEVWRERYDARQAARQTRLQTLVRQGEELERLINELVRVAEVKAANP